MSDLGDAIRRTQEQEMVYTLSPELRPARPLSAELVEVLAAEGLVILDWEHPDREHQNISLPLAALERIVLRLAGRDAP